MADAKSFHRWKLWAEKSAEQIWRTKSFFFLFFFKKNKDRPQKKLPLALQSWVNGVAMCCGGWTEDGGRREANPPPRFSDTINPLWMQWFNDVYDVFFCGLTECKIQLISSGSSCTSVASLATLRTGKDLWYFGYLHILRRRGYVLGSSFFFFFKSSAFS